VQVGACREERTEGVKMKVVRENLDDGLHEVFLGDNVLAIDNLFQNRREDGMAVHVQVDAFELGKTDKIRSDENTEISTLHLAAVAFTGMALMLQSDPELVHLDKIGENESDGVLQITIRTVMISLSFSSASPNT